MGFEVNVLSLLSQEVTFQKLLSAETAVCAHWGKHTIQGNSMGVIYKIQTKKIIDKQKDCNVYKVILATLIKHQKGKSQVL